MQHITLVQRTTITLFNDLFDVFTYHYCQTGAGMQTGFEPS